MKATSAARTAYLHGPRGRWPLATLGPPIYLRNPSARGNPRGEGAGVPWSTAVLVKRPPSGPQGTKKTDTRSLLSQARAVARARLNAANGEPQGRRRVALVCEMVHGQRDTLG